MGSRLRGARMIPPGPGVRATRMILAIGVLALSGVAAGDVPESKDAAPQRATADDMRIMAPYIGEFRSSTHTFDDGKTEHHFIIRYEWFDGPRTIVKFTVSMVIPSQDRVIVNAEGFYGFDPFHDQLYVFGAFSHGMSGWGSVCEFNHQTGARTVCARSKGADGVVSYVRDAFERVDENTWKNRTSVREGEDGEWKLVYEDTYARVAQPESR